jgi:cyclophilin family peptidyl-prolyl cis-trans isomerase
MTYRERKIEGLRARLVCAAGRGAIACVAVLAALAAAGCGGDQDAAVVSDNKAASGRPARGESVDPLHPVVEIDTSQGKIRVRLDAVNSPSTVRNFLNYASQDFYADTLIHYVDPDKMVVGGGYGVDGQPKSPGMTVRNEAHNGLKNVRGTIAMARDPSAGIDSATSQFFINLVDSPTFDHRGEESSEYGYCVFGKVVDGMDACDSISHAPTRDQGGDLAQMPDPPVVVESIRVVK